MRSNAEINLDHKPYDQRILEVLLDIRELLGFKQEKPLDKAKKPKRKYTRRNKRKSRTASSALKGESEADG